MGAKASEQFGTDHAVLLFDKINSMIGICPSNHYAKNAYRLKQKGTNRYRVIQAGRFCRHYNIKLDHTIVFDDAKINTEGVLVLDLKQTHNAAKLSA